MDKTPGPPLDSGSCVTLADLARYFTNALERSRVVEIENHLLECEYCRAFSDQVADIAQGEYEQDLASAATSGLDFLIEDPESYLGKDLIARLMPRIERWASRGAELTVRVLLPKLGEMASFVVSGMDAMLSPSSAFKPEQASVGAFLGTIESSGEGELEGPVLEIPGSGRKRARVVVDIGETTRVSVQIDNVPASITAPLVAIRPKAPGQTRIKEMTRVESISGDPRMIDLIVHFDLTEPVLDVLVVVEPFAE